MDDKQQQDIDVEAIMREVRADILAQRARAGEPVVNLHGRRFPAEYYNHLYQASLAYNSDPLKMQLSEIPVPILGPLLNWLRQKFHEVTLFYVNQAVERQVEMNRHLLSALNILSQELEQQSETEEDE